MKLMMFLGDVNSSFVPAKYAERFVVLREGESGGKIIARNSRTAEQLGWESECWTFDIAESWREIEESELELFDEVIDGWKENSLTERLNAAWGDMHPRMKKEILDEAGVKY